ncbi:MAG: hypothetical protein EBV06_13555 [Planctomycetia bacterium]|nr:hypothetical protein [Planctomycetia bacterium]
MLYFFAIVIKITYQCVQFCKNGRWITRSEWSPDRVIFVGPARRGAVEADVAGGARAMRGD